MCDVCDYVFLYMLSTVVGAASGTELYGAAVVLTLLRHLQGVTWLGNKDIILAILLVADPAVGPISPSCQAAIERRDRYQLSAWLAATTSASVYSYFNKYPPAPRLSTILAALVLDLSPVWSAWRPFVQLFDYMANFDFAICVQAFETVSVHPVGAHGILPNFDIVRYRVYYMYISISYPSKLIC
jgi:hypothetical protein